MIKQDAAGAYPGGPVLPPSHQPSSHGASWGEGGLNTNLNQVQLNAGIGNLLLLLPTLSNGKYIIYFQSEVFVS